MFQMLDYRQCKDSVNGTVRGQGSLESMRRERSFCRGERVLVAVDAQIKVRLNMGRNSTVAASNIEDMSGEVRAGSSYPRALQKRRKEALFNLISHCARLSRRRQPPRRVDLVRHLRSDRLHLRAERTGAQVLK